mmetsp:Transcript_24926/g.74205  ORF Transcript_24926/g.74205 Transcript_24926/m.74205 type:complete len:717 (+) Transcript_24926:90-2240(+)
MAVSNLAVLALSAAVLFGGAVGQESNVSPIRKVVMLIEEMKVQTEKDAKADLESYDKYMCWCKTNEAAKTTAIADAEATIEELTAFVEESKAKEGQLKTEIGQLQTDIAEDTDALATATATREKENEEFKATEADLTETIGLLKESVEILSKVQLLQKNGEAPSKELLDQAHRTTEILMQVKAKHVASRPSFAGLMQKDLFDMLGALGGPKDSFLPRRKMALDQASAMQPEISEEEAGMAARPNGQNGAAAGAKSYNSRSGKIFGLLSEMSEETDRDLAEARQTEKAAEEAFQGLKAAKEGEIAAATQNKDSKQAELAELTDKCAKAKADLEATQGALAADTEFLGNMKESCANEDSEYAKRAKVRSEEAVALTETLKILRSDDARDTFGKTIAFLQVSASTELAARQDRAADRAMKMIAKIAKKHRNWSLVALAVTVRLDAFEKVKAAMDKMLAELEKQQKEEYAKWTQCKKEIDLTEDEIKVKDRTKSDLEEKHQSLVGAIETLQTEISELQKDEADMEIALKQAGEQRKAENQVYKQSVMDQRTAINILNKALARMKEFYGFIQQPGSASSPEPAKGKAFSKSAGAGGVVMILETIIKEATTEEQELDADENTAQADYATLVRDTAASIEAARVAIEEKSAALAETETDKSETQEALLANGVELEKLADLLHNQHVNCDYVIKYFDLRQQARKEEMDSIKDAKAILSGADFGK